MPRCGIRSSCWYGLRLVMLSGVASALASCRTSPADPNATIGPSSSGSAARVEALSQKHAARSLADRMQAAADGCYVGSACDELEVRGLLAGAEDEPERDALRATARAAFAAQYALALGAQQPGAEQVSATGKGNATLGIRGPVCSRFFLEDFTRRPEAATSALLGFERIECSSQATRASLDLGPER